MEFVEIISWLTSLFGTLMSLSWFLQAYRIWKRKSSKDLSLPVLFVFFIGTVLWVIYGLLTKDLPVLVSFAVGFIGLSTVIAFALKYR